MMYFKLKDQDFYFAVKPGEECTIQPNWEEIDEEMLPEWIDTSYIPPATYINQRKLEYPPLSELADALVHQAMGNPVPMEEYVAACLAVKAKYPK
jgi:hypothetical protein